MAHGSPDRADALVREMNRRGIAAQAGARLYNVLIAAAGRRGDVGGIRTAERAMRDAGGQTELRDARRSSRRVRAMRRFNGRGTGVTERHGGQGLRAADGARVHRAGAGFGSRRASRRRFRLDPENVRRRRRIAQRAHVLDDRGRVGAGRGRGTGGGVGGGDAGERGAAHGGDVQHPAQVVRLWRFAVAQRRGKDGWGEGRGFVLVERRGSKFFGWGSRRRRRCGGQAAGR